MLSQQESAWAVYAAIFLLFTIFLSLRCRKNLLLIPFVVFGMLVTIGTICLLAAHSGAWNSVSAAMASAASTHQAFILNRYWQGKSLSLSLLPSASILLLVGIMEAQLIFIRHMAIALHNREHWGSIYLRDPEKSRGFVSSAQQNKKKRSLRPWTYWTSLVILVLYMVVGVCTVIVQTNVSMESGKDLGVAICASILCFLSLLNVYVVWSSCNSSANHIRTIRQNRDDLKFLRFTPVLFSALMVGVMTLSWIYYAVSNIPMSVWIVIESFTVYVPLLFIMTLCIYTSKIQTMGRQYPIEAAQKPKFQHLYSNQTMKDMEFVTKKLSQAEVTQQVHTPSPALYSHYQR
ncbi:unnamed protein product [Mucor hiemalis]